jgi:hypothetical protein
VNLIPKRWKPNAKPKRVMLPKFPMGVARGRLPVYNFTCATPLLRHTFFSQYMLCSLHDLHPICCHTPARWPNDKSASAHALSCPTLDIPLHESLCKFANDSLQFDRVWQSKTQSRSSPLFILSDVFSVFCLSGAHCQHWAGPPCNRARPIRPPL